MNNFFYKFFLLGFFIFSFNIPFIVSASVADGTIGSDQYAWGENVGWINFGHIGGNVHVTDTGLSGYVWDSVYGWINLNPENAGVKNNRYGRLSGYAWSYGAGYIDFDGVEINSVGRFTGQAKGKRYGRINFDCNYCGVVTNWGPSMGTSIFMLPPPAIIPTAPSVEIPPLPPPSPAEIIPIEQQTEVPTEIFKEAPSEETLEILNLPTSTLQESSVIQTSLTPPSVEEKAGAITKIVNNIETNVNNVISNVGKLVNNIGTSINNTIFDMKNLAYNIGTSMTDIISNAGELIKQNYEQTSTVIQKTYEQTITVAKEIIDTSLQYVKDKLNKFITPDENIPAELVGPAEQKNTEEISKETIQEKIPDIIPSAIASEEIFIGQTPIPFLITEANAKLADNIRTNMNNTVSNIKELINQSYEKTSIIIQKTYQQTINIAKELIIKTKETINTLFNILDFLYN